MLRMADVELTSVDWLWFPYIPFGKLTIIPVSYTHLQNGDYLIPNIVIRKTKPLGHYGRLRKAYLEMHRPIPVSYTHLDVYKRQD